MSCWAYNPSMSSADTLKSKKKQLLSLGEPPLYKVYLLNDDFTPMDFVVALLQDIFHQSLDVATDIMLNIHHQGKGLCGLYPREIAETKIKQVHQKSKHAEHPLRCIMEKDHAE